MPGLKGTALEHESASLFKPAPNKPLTTGEKVILGVVATAIAGEVALPVVLRVIQQGNVPLPVPGP